MTAAPPAFEALLETIYRADEHLDQAVVVGRTRRPYPRNLGTLVRLRRCSDRNARSNDIDSLYPADIAEHCYWDATVDDLHRPAVDRCPGCLLDRVTSRSHLIRYSPCVRHGAAPGGSYVKVIHLAPTLPIDGLFGQVIRAACGEGPRKIAEPQTSQYEKTVRAAAHCMCHLLRIPVVDVDGALQFPLRSDPSNVQLSEAGNVFGVRLGANRFMQHMLETLAEGNTEGRGRSEIASRILDLVDAVTTEDDDKRDCAIKELISAVAEKVKDEAFLGWDKEIQREFVDLDDNGWKQMWVHFAQGLSEQVGADRWDDEE